MSKLRFILFSCLIFSTKLFAVPASSDTNHAIAQEGNLLVEIQQKRHSHDYHHGNLLYRVGRIEGDRIEWGAITEFDQGIYTTLAISGNQVVLMHEDLHTNRLWYHLGQIYPDKLKIQWSTAQEYNEGRYPSLTTDGINVFVSYRGRGILNKLYYQTGIIDMENESIAWTH